MGKLGAQTVRQVLTPLSLEGRRAARHGDALTLPDGTPVGQVTSGSFAPSLGHGIALAWVDASHVGAEHFVVHAAKTALPAVKADIPFYKAGTARQKLA